MRHLSQHRLLRSKRRPLHVLTLSLTSTHQPVWNDEYAEQSIDDDVPDRDQRPHDEQRDRRNCPSEGSHSRTSLGDAPRPSDHSSCTADVAHWRRIGLRLENWGRWESETSRILISGRLVRDTVSQRLGVCTERFAGVAQTVASLRPPPKCRSSVVDGILISGFCKYQCALCLQRGPRRLNDRRLKLGHNLGLGGSRPDSGACICAYL